MARIRSVHPGLFTDEAFVSLSDAAQIFLIGLWTEADDQGVFDWKPVTLRMRLRGGKDGAVEPLLSELEAADCIKSAEIDGRKVGAIRNFRRFQRPKTPKARYVITELIRSYVGLGADNSETDGNEAEPFPQKGEKSPQRKGEENLGRGGGRRISEADETLVSTHKSSSSLQNPVSARNGENGANPPSSAFGLEGQSSEGSTVDETNPAIVALRRKGSTLGKRAAE